MVSRCNVTIPLVATCVISVLAGAGVGRGQSSSEPRRFPPSNTDMVWIPGGEFRAGCVAGDQECLSDEKPELVVSGQPGFWLDVTEVTVAQFRRFTQATAGRMPPLPAFGQGENDPVVNVTWDDAARYCAWAEKALPTELQWEVAARGGQPSAKYPTGDSIDHDRANFASTGGRDRWTYLAPVGSFEHNGFGLHDMAGNVWEWCADWYDPQLRVAGADAPTSGTMRVLKGGAWNSTTRSLRVSNRGRFAPASRHEFIGFRCTRTARADDLPGGTAVPETQPARTPPAVQARPSATPTPAAQRVATPSTQLAMTQPSSTQRSSGTPPGTAPTLQKLPPSGDEMIWLAPAEFEMGCVRGDSECSGDEQPRHRVAFPKGYWIGQDEVTLGQYRAFSHAASHPLPRQPEWVEDQHPVVNVTWEDAQSYCAWAGGRLPTEAEWEYAARAGANTKFPAGRTITHDEANFDGVGGRDQWPKSAPVGSFPPNAFGLHDMLGNVREWCLDWYDDKYYFASPAADPPGPASGNLRSARGGSWTSDPGRLRLSYRDSMEPTLSMVSTGFRCVIPGK